MANRSSSFALADEQAWTSPWRKRSSAIIEGQEVSIEARQRIKGIEGRWARSIGAPFSIKSLRSCISLALAYGWIAYFFGWGLGGSGRLGDIIPLAQPGQPARMVSALCLILSPFCAIALGRWLGRIERRGKHLFVRHRRKASSSRRKRLRLRDFERYYRWLLTCLFAVSLLTVLIVWRRADIAAFIILFSWLAMGPVAGIAAARRFQRPIWQTLGALMAGVLAIGTAFAAILTVATAGVSTFAFAVLGITQVALAGAFGVLLDLVMGGAWTIGLALAGAGVATVALALAGAGTGMATLTGVATLSRAGLAAFAILMTSAWLAALAFQKAAIAAGAIAGLGTIAAAAAIAHNRRGHDGAFAGASGTIALLVGFGLFLGWGDEPLLIFTAVVILFLPAVNGLIDWLTLGLAAHVLRLCDRGDDGIGSDGMWLGLSRSILVLGIALAMVSLLAFLMGFGLETINRTGTRFAGHDLFLLTSMIEGAVMSPFTEGLWLALLLATPLMLASMSLVPHLAPDRQGGHRFAMACAQGGLAGLLFWGAIIAGFSWQGMTPAIWLGELAAWGAGVAG